MLLTIPFFFAFFRMLQSLSLIHISGDPRTHHGSARARGRKGEGAFCRADPHPGARDRPGSGRRQRTYAPRALSGEIWSGRGNENAARADRLDPGIGAWSSARANRPDTRLEHSEGHREDRVDSGDYRVNPALDTPPFCKALQSPLKRLESMQPTFRPHRKKRARKIGYRARRSTRGGRKVLTSRRKKGRKRLTVV